MSLGNHIKKDKLKWFLTLGAIALLTIAVISLFVKLGKDQTTTNLNNGAYSIGSIDTTTGKEIDSKQNIRSDFFKTEDMIIDVEDNSQITYKVAFYDTDKDFISITESQSTDFVTTSNPTTAVYFRILITPNVVDGENVQISIFNMAKYTDMLNVTVNK